MADSKKIQQEEKIKPHRKKKPINYRLLGIIISSVIFISISLIGAWKQTNPTSANCTLEQLYDMKNANRIEKVNITKTANTFLIYTYDGEVYSCVNPRSDTFIYDLMKDGINVEVQSKTLFDAIDDLIIVIPTFVITIMLCYYLSNTIVGGSTKMFTLLKKGSNQVKFEDIAGISEVKDEVNSIVMMIKNYKKLAENGARPVKGLLLYGPPGVGKTLLAKAIANEVNMPFISASGSDFNEMFVGVGAARVRNLYDLALQNAPCILFIDEIDSLGKRRGGSGGADGEKNQTLNALLQRLDGLNPGNGVFVIAATNRKEDLDPALLRPGRFDRHIFIGKPRLKKDKEEVIALYLKTKRLDKDVTLEAVSNLISDMSGAEIEDALNNAVYNSFKRGGDGVINLNDIDSGIMSLLTDGVQVDIASDHDRKITAVHEAGHAIVNLLLDRKVVKVSVIPYSSGIGGLTQTTNKDKEDDKLRLQSEFRDDIKVLLAGMCAEDIIFGEHTQGASNDIERASSIARNMIVNLAFGDRIVNTDVLARDGGLALQSEKTLDECERMLIELKEETTDLLVLNKDRLIEMSNKLMETSTILYPTLD